MGDLLLVLLPAVVLAAILWGLATALRPRGTGMSEADKYQRELAERAARHYAAQVQAAMAARARLEPGSHPGGAQRRTTGLQDHSRADSPAIYPDLAAARKHTERY
ncbi:MULTISPECIES: hypothetical protein [unclassified Arthrobacter]|uniref:hypothetical protein n=1 Tax=unclassified Arthrobacter TaxID=235627 RepID=UPI001C84ECCE|nr:hypothetical protein [Arthrobacter sp. MAHUQ-56]MBX7443202.1 hypothetical protein [Arthrobacter sp. MAHUQ-56]